MNLLGVLAFLLGSRANTPPPAPDLGPGQVVRIVATALRNNNSPIPNAGVFTAYGFASAANRAATGPYGRFLQIVKAPDFIPMLRAYPQEFGPIEISGDHAEQTLQVRLDNGESAEYRFSLSKQTAGLCRGCWMVDGVGRLR